MEANDRQCLPIRERSDDEIREQAEEKLEPGMSSVAENAPVDRERIDEEAWVLAWVCVTASDFPE